MTNPPQSLLFVPVSAGELIDKKTILEIKRDRIQDRLQVANVERELALLAKIAHDAFTGSVERSNLASLEAQLKEINEGLWNLENAVREHERLREFGDAFVASARKIYSGNDRRAAVKREINRLTGSPLVEEKSHK